MPPKSVGRPPGGAAESKKRKEPPKDSSRGRDSKRPKMYEARSILTQPSDAALKNGDLDMQSFLKCREFEIKALQDSMEKSKQCLASRAFQQVPRDMRRRTASHNVKRVPKRLQKRAAREMIVDNTPTVDPNKRKPGSSRGWIRAETAKKLGILAAKKKATRQRRGEDISVKKTRAARPKIRKDLLNDPRKPASKFRKRQIHKTWLPTHMWLTKRAKMTEPKNPLWRFAVPITSTQKSYRPTHRASGARGAVAWDMSYMSTIKLDGPASSLEKVLNAMGVTEQSLWDERDPAVRWRCGKRSWKGWLSREIEQKSILISPATILWSPTESEIPDGSSKKLPPRQVFIRVHPSAFLEIWTELLRLSKIQHPTVSVEDLRFEIGSIEIMGPGSTETLLGILHPCCQLGGVQEDHGKIFEALAGVTNPGSLPLNAMLSFNIMDPRLRYPPRPVKLPDSENDEANFSLLKLLSAWPADGYTGSAALFDRDARFKATRLAAQKSLNRRKALAPPGDYPTVKDTDPQIPIILLATRASISQVQGSWTLLAPWKCILPIWYGLVHYPLSSGGNPRFGGLQELRQTYYERGLPWFPADYPGTDAGFSWEIEERVKRKADWNKRPKGKRVEWSSVDLGRGRRGEIGQGWACDYEQILERSSTSKAGISEDASQKPEKTNQELEKMSQQKTKDIKIRTYHFPTRKFTSLLSSATAELPPPSFVTTIRITLIARGVATPCARIYRLPPPRLEAESNTLSAAIIPSPHSPQTGSRAQWLALLPPPTKSKLPKNPKSKCLKKVGRIPLNTPLPQRIQLLAQSLLQNPPLQYPRSSNDVGDGHLLVPDEEDLIGFVTTGEFCLVEGRGVAIGTVFVDKTAEGVRRGKKGEGKLCIVRNSGEKIGWLARWEEV